MSSNLQEIDAQIDRLKQRRQRIAAAQKEKAKKERNHRLILWGVTVEKSMVAGDMSGDEFAQLVACHLDAKDRAAALVGIHQKQKENSYE
ncbi:MAG: hypothetical protein ABW161_02605 [Candidatus Thiodiazotropha sp.]